MKTPCFKCECRHQGCHSECEQYKKYRAVYDRAKVERMKKSDVTDFTIKNTVKIQKKLKGEHRNG